MHCTLRPAARSCDLRPSTVRWYAVPRLLQPV
jgi:hypothetical protein